jgi:hypothetical protein
MACHYYKHLFLIFRTIIYEILIIKVRFICFLIVMVLAISTHQHFSKKNLKISYFNNCISIIITVMGSKKIARKCLNEQFIISLAFFACSKFSLKNILISTSSKEF